MAGNANSGRPPKERTFATMLRLAVNEVGQTGQPKLRELADVLVTAALNGESWALQQVADRLDGKPGQSIDLDANVTFEDILARLK